MWLAFWDPAAGCHRLHARHAELSKRPAFLDAPLALLTICPSYPLTYLTHLAPYYHSYPLAHLRPLPLMPSYPTYLSYPPSGIYVSDILDAVPIDKYFELFKPGAGGEGGFIRLGLDYGSEPPELIQGANSRDGAGGGGGGVG